MVLSKKLIKILERDNFKEKFIDLYINKFYSIALIAKELNICPNTVHQFITYFNLSRDNHKVKSKSNSEAKNKLYDTIKNKITKDILYQWYIIEDHYYNESAKHFGISQWMFDRLCADYNIRKDRSKSNSKHLTKMYEKYGSKKAYFKHVSEENKKTKIDKYGSLDNYYQQMLAKMKSTMLERYGYDFCFNDPNNPRYGKKADSKPNLLFKDKLISNNIKFTREFNLDSKSYDFKVDNILIELNPTITHNIDWIPFGDHDGLDRAYHLIKSDLAKKNNFRCIHIWDWDDQEKIINCLCPKETVYARNCRLSIIEDYSELDDFLNQNHFQNTCKGQRIALGLYHNDMLIQVMTFGKPRYSKRFEYELLRLCTKSKFKVVGGSEKLFKYFIDHYNPISIISYCDLSKFNGDIYSKLNFTHISDGVPTIHWYNIKTKQHITDNLLRQRGFDQLFNTNYGKGTCNEDLMKSAGFFRVCDCGQSVYIYNKV